MRWPWCGEENGDDSKFCHECGGELRGDRRRRERNPIPARPVDYLFWSVLASFFCSPLSLISLFLAIMARRSYAQGQFALAESRAESARRYFWVTLFLGIVISGVSVYMNWDSIVQEYNNALAVATGAAPQNDPVANIETVENTSEVAPTSEPQTSPAPFDAPSIVSEAPTSTNAPEVLNPSESENAPRGAVQSETPSTRTTETQSLSDFFKNH